jgi:hypothetical protein
MTLPSRSNPFGLINRPRFFKRVIEFQTSVLGGARPGTRNFWGIPHIPARPKHTEITIG